MPNLQPCCVGAAIVTGLIFGSVASQASERQLDAHAHGVSTLKIAQEENVIIMELEAPGNDIVGFEHAAKNADQKTVVDEALSNLKNAESLFVLPRQAECVASEQKAEFEAEGDHAGFHVMWKLTCKQLKKATSLTIRYFDMFERAREVEVEAIGDAGQASIEVERDNPKIDLSQIIGG